MFLGYQGAGTFTQNGGQVAVKEVNGNGNTGFLSIGNTIPHQPIPSPPETYPPTRASTLAELLAIRAAPAAV